MNGVFLKKLKESVISVLPIMCIVIVINYLTMPMNTLNLLSFIFGSILLIFGMCLYTLGVDTAMTPMGENIGSKVTKTRKFWFILLISFILGIIITIAEPDLAVLESQSGIKNLTLIIAVGIGVFMVIATLRIILRIKIRFLFLILYGLLFGIIAIAFFINPNVIPIAFDSGGVTTGPITVPFIMALSSGITGILGGSGQEDSEFGTIGICSVGPILMVILFALLNGSTPTGEHYEITNYSSFGQLISHYLTSFPSQVLSVTKSLAPIIIFFVIYQIFSLKLTTRVLLKICFGLLYSIIGLTLFFMAVNVGFMQTGAYIGNALATVNKWSIVPIGMLVGLFIVFAEPAVHVLAKQVEDVTNGVITGKTMLFTLALSMAISIGLAMLRVVTQINLLWFVIPGYVIAIALMFVVPEVFTGIAFDSGGVASGPMTATFLLPFTAGASLFLNGEAGVEQTFGVVALVAMTPLLAVQIIGVIYNVKLHSKRRLASGYFADMLAHEGEIIDLDALKTGKNVKSYIKVGLAEKIRILKGEIDELKHELALKRAKLTRYMKKMSNLKKEEK